MITITTIESSHQLIVPIGMSKREKVLPSPPPLSS